MAQHYNYFRDYDPVVGRYVQSDFLGIKGGLNLYAYADARPIGKVDVYGLSSMDPPDWRKPNPGFGGAASGSGAIAKGVQRLINQCRPKGKCVLYEAEFMKDPDDMELFPSSPTIRYGGRVWCRYKCDSGNTKQTSYYVGPSQVFNNSDAWQFCPKTEEE